MPTRGEPAQPRFGPWRREARALLELCGLTGVVFAQPIFDVLSKNPNVFLIQDVTPLQAGLFVALVLVVPPLCGWVVEVVAGLVRPAARPTVHHALLALLVGVLAVEVIARFSDVSRSVSVALAVPVAVAAGVVVSRAASVRQWLRYLAVASVLFAVVFLAFSPVTEAVFSEGPTSAADVQIRNDTRVVMIVLDEFPEASLLDGSGQVDAELYPHFAELAGGSTWYRNTTSVAGYTQIALPSLLTGNYPTRSYPVDNAAAFPDNLFTLLGGAYDMNVHETATRLCPSSFCGEREVDDGDERSGVGGLLGSAWTAWNRFAWPDRSKGTVSFAEAPTKSSDHALRTGDDFVRSLRPGRAARLDFLHVLLPHQAWHYLPTGQDYEEGAARGAPFYSWATDHVARTARQRHLLQLQATDRLLGRIIDRLRALDVFDRSLVVVTADHGIAFERDEASRGLSPGAYEQVMWTPFFVKAPGQREAAVDDRPLQTIDVLPTIADHLDVDLPWKVDGRSALGPARQEDTRPFYKWSMNLIEPERGTDFVQLDGREGFARVLRSRAAPPGDDPDLRLYQDGPYGHLVGSEAGPRITRAGATGPPGRIKHRARYDDVDLDADRVPWAYLYGSLRAGDGVDVAIVVNGRIAAFSETYDTGDDPSTPFWAMLPPPLFQEGRNEVAVYVVEGPVGDPRLVPVDLGT